jgi:serine/threonine-protein kinase
VELVGSGSYGDVYRAWDPRLDREVALKLLRRRVTSDASPVIEEGRLLARVRHPNAVTVHGADYVDGRAGIWMEFIDGITLEDDLRRRGPLPVAEVAAIGVTLCQALDAVHKVGIVHRDLKAQNVMRDAAGRIVLMDFGSGVSDEPRDAAVGGTPLYLSPEVLVGSAATIRSDIYAVGVLLFHLLTGGYPFEGSSVDDVRARQRLGQPASLRRARRDVPKRLRVAIERALAVEPLQRYETASDFERALTGGVQVRSYVLVPVAGAASVAAVVAAIWWSRPVVEPSFVFHPRDYVLVTAFENRTGERELNGVVEHALEREISNSAHVSLAPRARVEDTLLLLQRPAAAVLDAAVGREVCERDGRIPALIAGTIDRRGATYSITTDIRGCSAGSAAATLVEQVNDRQSFGSAIRRLAAGVRERLGEDPETVQRSSPQTGYALPDMAALRLYREAFDAGTRHQWKESLNLARDAVAADETFAAAHVWLAWSMRNNLMEPAEYVPVAEKAVALSASAMDWERQWILGSYFEMAGDDDRAEAAYRTLVQLRPDHFWGLNNLVRLYQRRNQPSSAVAYAARLADLRPSNPGVNSQAALLVFEVTRDFAWARSFATRTLRESGPGLLQAWATFFDAAVHLANRDIPHTEAAVMRTLATAKSQPVATRDAIVAGAIRYLLALGKGRQARAALEGFEDRGYYHPLYRALTAFHAGDPAAARAAITAVPSNDDLDVTTSLFLRLGMTGEAKAFLGWAPPGKAKMRDALLNGSLAAASGASTRSISMLAEQAAFRLPGNHARTLAELADAWLQRGDRSRAIAVLQESWRRDPHMDVNVKGPHAHDWMPNALLLAELYWRDGRTSAAEPIEADLRRLLSTADSDFPLLIRLNSLQSGSAAGNR